MQPKVLKKALSAAAVERLPRTIRALLGCAAAAVAVAITYYIPPLRAFPLLLAFPTVILSAWFLGMPGAIACGLAEAFLVDRFLTRSAVRFSLVNSQQQVRLGVFVTVSILLGWIIRKLATDRARLISEELERRLSLANAERQLAEERVAAAEALRDREAMLQVALSANGMGLWIWDPQRGTSHWSEEVYRKIGIEPAAIEPTFAAWLSSVHPEDRDRVDQTVVRASEAGAGYHCQYRVVWPDGSVHWLESQGKPHTDGEGKLIRIVGVVTEVTQRKRTEEAMLRSEKLAVAGRLAASVAHEINNPLEAVSNLLFLITLTDSLDRIREHARHALDQLMRVSLITQQTLRFHRQTGQPRPTRISEVLDAVLIMFRAKLTAANVDVDIRVKEEREVVCMPGELHQIFANLISNSIEAMPHGGRLAIRIRPSLDWRDGKTGGMRITFFDAGTGMDKITRQRLFEPFFTTKADTGTGLGMWVVAQLLERPGGSIRIWSTQRPGRSGTAFSVFHPLTWPVPADSPQPAAELTKGRTDAGAKVENRAREAEEVGQEID